MQHVVGLLLPDLTRNRLLVAASPGGYPLEGHNAVRQAQPARQFRDDRNFIGLAIHRRPGRH